MFSNLILTTIDFLLQLAVAAFVIQFTTRVVAGFKPPFSRTLIAVACAYVAALVIGLVVEFVSVWSGFDAISVTLVVFCQMFQIFVGGLLAYSWILKDPAKEPIGIRKAAQVAGIEVLVRIIVIALMFGLFSVVKGTRYNAAPISTPSPSMTQ